MLIESARMTFALRQRIFPSSMEILSSTKVMENRLLTFAGQREKVKERRGKLRNFFLFSL